MVRCPTHAHGAMPIDPNDHAGLPLAIGRYGRVLAGIARGYVDLDDLRNE